jgi:hypothetical protein
MEEVGEDAVPKVCEVALGLVELRETETFGLFWKNMPVGLDAGEL